MATTNNRRSSADRNEAARREVLDIIANERQKGRGEAPAKKRPIKPKRSSPVPTPLPVVAAAQPTAPKPRPERRPAVAAIIPKRPVMSRPTPPPSSKPAPVKPPLSVVAKPPEMAGGAPSIKPAGRSRGRRVVLGALIGIGALLVAGLGTFGVGIYVFHWENPATLAVTSVVPYPAAMVDTSFVGYHDYLLVLNALRKNAAAQAAQFGDNVQTFSDSEAQQNALDQLVSTVVLRRVAGQRGIAITPADIDTMIASVVHDYGSDTVFDQTVRQFYDWDRAQFTHYVLEPLLLRQAVHKNISQDSSLTENQAAKTKIEQAKTRLAGGEDFAAVATDLSDDSSASAGGDLGFQRLSVFPSQTFIDAVRALEVGQTSDIIQTEFGYHIVRLEEKVPDAGGVTENDTYRLRHIMAETVSADAWLEAQTRNSTIRYFVPHPAKTTAATGATPIP